jgi:SAM-dependent methyltransferase
MINPDTTVPIEVQIAAIRREVAARPRLVEHYDALIAGLPKQRLVALIAKHGQFRGMKGELKYLDCPFWIYQKLLFAQHLGLIGGSAKRVLDIGMGGGHFSYVLGHLGHEAVGIDIPNPIYEDICSALDVVRITRTVRRDQPVLDSDERFDLVTAFAAQFFNEGGGKIWTTSEWIEFLERLILRHIRPPGRIYFRLNRMPPSSVYLVDMPKVAREFGGSFAAQGILDIPVSTAA